MVKFAAKLSAGLLATGLLAVAGAGAASAQASVQYTIQNQFGSTVTLDTASCSSGSVSPPFSISNGGTGSATGSTSGTTTLCNIRYQSGSFGCQFQLQVSASGGFASANAYKGSGGRPTCSVISEGRTGTSTYSGTFRMK